MNGLERYFNKWRNYCKVSNDYATKIQNAFRIYKAKKERERLDNINKLLKKMIDKYDKIINANQRSKLRKWNKNTNLINCNEKANIIQKYIKPRLYKLLNDKFKNYFFNNGPKRLFKLISYLGKINNLHKSLIKPKLSKFMDNLKKIAEMKNKNEKLGKVLEYADDKVKKILIKKYIKKWIDNNKKIEDKKKNNVVLIQKIYKKYKKKKNDDRLIKRKEKLIYQIEKKANSENNKLSSYFMKWLNITRNLQCNDNARIIQKFCREIQDKLNKKKELQRQIKIENGLQKLCNIKFGAKYFFDKLISEINKNIFSDFNNILKNKKLDILKDSFDKIKQRAFDNILSNALNISDNLRNRILRKNLNIWKENADKLAKKRAAEKWKIYLKQKNKSQILRKILHNLVLQKSNLLKNYFNKWKNVTKKLEAELKRNMIAQYIRERFKISKARENWIRLLQKFKLQNRNENIFEVVTNLKKIKIMEKLKKTFDDLARKKFIKKIKETQKKSYIKETFEKLIPKTDDINNYNLLKHHFDKWKNNSDKIKLKEEKLNQALDIITKKQTLNDINDMNRALMLKKLLHDLNLVKAKLFIDKIKSNADKKNKYENLAQNILNAKENLDNDNMNKFIDKLYKLYAYKKLDNMCNSCNNYSKRIKNACGKEFLYKLILIKTKNLSFKYNNKIDSTKNPKLIKISFKSKVNKLNSNIFDKSIALRKVLPNLINYISNLIKKRNENTFTTIKNELINNKFKNLLEKFNQKFTEPKKAEFVEKLKREEKYAKTRPLYQVKLFRLLRKKYIQIITTSLIEPSSLYKLFYLINITGMHKNISKQRFYRELIRKWRFLTFTKKMARKKLELMYKNLHASYLQMADEIFGDDNNVNPSVFKEFEKFGLNVGMFTGQEPEIDEEINKKYYSNVDRKYVFTNKANMTLPRSEKVIKRIESEEIIEKKDIKGKNNSQLRHSLTQNFDKKKK